MNKRCTFSRLWEQPEQSLVVEATKLYACGEENNLQVNLTELWCCLSKGDKSLSFQDLRKIDPFVPTEPMIAVWSEVLCIAVGDIRALVYKDSLMLFRNSLSHFLLSHVTQHLSRNKTAESFYDPLHPRITLFEGIVSGIILLLEKELAELEPQLLQSLEALQNAYDYDQLGILRKCSKCLETLLKKCDNFYSELENMLQDNQWRWWVSNHTEQVESLLEPYLQVKTVSIYSHDMELLKVFWLRVEYSNGSYSMCSSCQSFCGCRPSNDAQL